MKAEIVAMTAQAIDEKAIARGGEILKKVPENRLIDELMAEIEKL